MEHERCHKCGATGWLGKTEHNHKPFLRVECMEPECDGRGPLSPAEDGSNVAWAAWDAYQKIKAGKVAEPTPEQAEAVHFAESAGDAMHGILATVLRICADYYEARKGKAKA